MYSLDPSLVPRLFHKESGNKSRNEAIWPPDPSGHARKIFRPCEEGSFGHARKGLGNNLARKCRAGMAQFFNPANFLFRSSTQVLFQFSKFLCSIYCFLSLVGWLADVAFFLSSTPTATFQHSKHFRKRLYSRPFLAWVWDPDYIQCMHTHYDCSLIHRPSHSLLFCRFQLDKNKGGKV